MADSGGDGGTTTGAPIAGPGMAFEPFFKMWSEWMANNMGPMTTVPGASLPWLTKPGLTTGEETKPLPQGAMANDPLLSAIDQVWDANPLRNIVPLDWAEIIRALQTLWMREMSNPQRVVQKATEYNQRLFQTTMNIWTDAASRFWGLQEREEEEEEDNSDPRFSAPEWESNPFYAMLKESYFLATEYLLNEAKETDGQGDTAEQQRLEFHLRQFVEAMAPVNFLFTNPEVAKRAFETGERALSKASVTSSRTCKTVTSAWSTRRPSR